MMIYLVKKNERHDKKGIKHKIVLKKMKKEIEVKVLNIAI